MFGLSGYLSGQTLQGIVSDAETHLPLESVMVSVLRNGKTIDYALTNEQGHYTLAWHYTDSLQVAASYLGYRREIHWVEKAGRLDWQLKPESIVLREVEIRPGRIYGRKDTIRYDLSKFASEKDQRVRDVLKRLPGVDVEESGRVTYNGKAIDHFLVEGMDLTGGRYNQISNTLSAKAVKTAEIMENYQSVKMLKQKINSNEVALNLRLDPKVRDQWIVNGEGGIGITTNGEDEDNALLWEGGLNALQLGQGKQTLYNYKSNNTGVELSNEQQMLASGSGHPNIAFKSLLSQPGINTPLDTRRILLNETHTVNANRMYKYPNDRSLRIQADYTHDEREQHRSSSTLYFQPTDTLRQEESLRYRRRSDIAHVEVQYEDNNEHHYLLNRTRLEGNRSVGISPEAGQEIETGMLKLNNRFSWMRNTGNHTWEVRSSAQAAWQPSALHINNSGGVEQEKFDQHQLYMDNDISYLHKKNGFTQRYRIGLQGEFLNVDRSIQGNYSNASLYFRPYFQQERGAWLAYLSTAIEVRRYFHQDKSYFLYSPSIFLRYEPTHRWRFSVSGNVERNTGDALNLCPTRYRSDYRTWQDNGGLMPVNITQSYQAYGEYKNTLQEFFITLRLSYLHTHANSLYEQQVAEDSIIYTRRHIPNGLESYSAGLTVSKGIYDWRMKSSFNLSAGHNRGKQLTVHIGQASSLLQTYRYNYLNAEPKLSWLPTTWLEMDYHGTLTYSRTKIGSDTRLSPLFNMVHRLKTTVSIGQLDIRIGGEYYRNDLGNGSYLHSFLADASLIYKVKKWRIEACLQNLLNKQAYEYTLYSNTQSHTSRLGIRPREALIKASWQF